MKTGMSYKNPKISVSVDHDFYVETEFFVTFNLMGRKTRFEVFGEIPLIANVDASGELDRGRHIWDEIIVQEVYPNAQEIWPALNDGDVVLKDAKKIEADLQQAADTDEAPELVQALVDRHIGGPFPIES